MTGDTLTTDNLLSILKAMTKIAPTDQSQNYRLYIDEQINKLKNI